MACIITSIILYHAHTPHIPIVHVSVGKGSHDNRCLIVTRFDFQAYPNMAIRCTAGTRLYCTSARLNWYITGRLTSAGVYVPFGLVVRIPGFHPGGPGSIPGVGRPIFFLLLSLYPGIPPP